MERVMKMRLLSGAALTVLVVVSACAQPKAGTAADETAIREMGAKYADAFNKGDTSALAALVTEDFQAVSTDGTMTSGRAAFEAEEKKQATARMGLQLKLAVETKFVKWADADHAAIGGSWTMAGVPAGMGADKGAWSSVAEKGADGQWRLSTALVANAEAPPPTPTPASTPAPTKGKGK
jgi:uncharacterized protein (TIGR02246 family)